MTGPAFKEGESAFPDFFEIDSNNYCYVDINREDLRTLDSFYTQQNELVHNLGAPAGINLSYERTTKGIEIQIWQLLSAYSGQRAQAMSFPAVVFDIYPWEHRADGLFYVGVDKPIFVRPTEVGTRILYTMGASFPTQGLFTQMSFRSIAQYFGPVVGGREHPYAKNALYIPAAYKPTA